MGGLAHFLEDEGLATTHISLVRPQTENTRPPRALWVPFELGRPMGAPNEPEFQTRVLRAALALLERVDGPVVVGERRRDKGLADPSGRLCGGCRRGRRRVGRS